MVTTERPRTFGRRSLACALLILFAAYSLGTTGKLAACPFCFGSLQLTLREQIDTADATVIVRWKSGEPGDLNKQTSAVTSFEVVKVLRGDLQAGDALKIDRYQEGRAGDEFLMSGNLLEGDVKWDRSVPLSAEAICYLNELPGTAATATERVRYALPYLESADDMVATDAFTVLASAHYNDIAALRAELPQQKLRSWLFGKQKLKGQRGVYGMLLGLCGTEADRDQLMKLILDTRGPDDFRLGIGGVMGGYLLLAGGDGLDALEKEFLSNPNASSSDRAAMMEALRFMGEYAEDRISRPTLAKCVRQNLATSDLPEISIADLARWQDWSATNQLLEWYGRPKCDKFIRKAIINFMLVASQSDSSNLSESDRGSIAAAKAFLEALEREEPRLFQEASRVLIPRS